MTIEVTPSRWPKYGTPEPLRVCPAWSSNARSSARVNRSPSAGWSPRRWRDANPPAPRQAPHQAVASSSWRGNSDGRPEAAVDRATQPPESPIGIETTRAAVILAGSGQFALGVPGTLLGLRVLPLGAGPLLGRSRLLLLGVRLARCRAVANVARLNAALLLAARSRSEGRRDERQDHGARDDGDDDNRAHLSLLLGSTAFRAVSGYPAPREQTGGERPPRCQLTLADQPVGAAGTRICSIESARPSSRTSTTTALTQTSSSAVSNFTGIWVRKDSSACSRRTPMTPAREPVIPTSVMKA